MDEIVLDAPGRIGDALLATPAIRAFKRVHQSTRVTVCCANDGPFQVLRYNPHVDRLLMAADASTLPGRRIELDAETALKTALAERQSLAWGFGRMLGVDVDDLRYDYAVDDDDRAMASALIGSLGEGRPVVIVARHSPTCLSNHPAVLRANKCIANIYWVVCAENLLRRGYVPVAIGARHEADDPRYRQWPGKRLYGEPLRVVAALCAQSRGVLTIDNGIRHLAVAAGANVYALSCTIGLRLISCRPVREGQRIVEEYVPIERANARTVRRGAELLQL
jgi:ADP-heptose:LPS heptosyltransferase